MDRACGRFGPCREARRTAHGAMLPLHGQLIFDRLDAVNVAEDLLGHLFREERLSFAFDGQFAIFVRLKLNLAIVQLRIADDDALNALL